MKKTLFSILLIGICMTGVANAKEKNPILLKQVYKKEELITLDKQKVAGGNGTLHGNLPLLEIWLLKMKLSKK